MIYVLLFIIALLVLAIIHLNIQFHKQEEIFRIKYKELQNSMLAHIKNQSEQRVRMQLSEDLEKQLRQNEKALSVDIYRLNFDLFTLLSKNDLLKK
jgi:hypothetical protein